LYSFDTQLSTAAHVRGGHIASHIQGGDIDLKREFAVYWPRTRPSSYADATLDRPEDASFSADVSRHEDNESSAQGIWPYANAARLARDRHALS
jgi:hypothetical protein